ncbi:SAM-dependent methyltransferase [Amycolatopsis benzoatilytica]|uniref:SAM-dependent methyltransferase n=1 Tax=Amycolatopsis benzoatilytica TaxID=346045 RepID=UPI0003A19141|nr:cyclopropane-fatty-acyl-phospholipid synthase family protein [Amycolatopsis benzoatilytica]
MSTSRVDPTVVSQPVPDEARWPGLATPPHSPLRARAAEALFRHAVKTLAVRVTFPDGTVLGAGGPSAPEMRVHRPAAEANTIEGSRSNIHRHYDLSNDLFSAFLDESMMYSSALFGPGDTLTQAQHRKLDSVLDYAGVREGSEVLEIGTGWGELSIRAASRGAKVTSLTISQEQKVLADARIAEAGLSDRIEVRLCDYREATGEYDSVVSVEMIEAVGASYWPTFFSTIGKRLRPGGQFGLQAITMDHDRMLAAAKSYTWIHKYIFPGGIIPSVHAIEEGMRENTRLKLAGMREFGHDYARTLKLWRDRFHQRWDDIRGFGFDDVFHRMWEFYLAYSEAGFRSGYLKVHQFGFADPR